MSESCSIFKATNAPMINTRNGYCDKETEISCNALNTTSMLLGLREIQI
jgi:hypothetical protein